jgi:hypothetical protein
MGPQKLEAFSHNGGAFFGSISGIKILLDMTC